MDVDGWLVSGWAMAMQKHLQLTFGSNKRERGIDEPLDFM